MAPQKQKEMAPTEAEGDGPTEAERDDPTEAEGDDPTETKGDDPTEAGVDPKGRQENQRKSQIDRGWDSLIPDGRRTFKHRKRQENPEEIMRVVIHCAPAGKRSRERAKRILGPISGAGNESHGLDKGPGAAFHTTLQTAACGDL